MSARKQADLDEAVATLKQHGISAHAIAADLSQDEQAAQLVDGAIAHLGHIDILINNAGASWGAPAEDHPVEAWDKVMDLNIRSIFVVSQLVGKRSMIPRGYGRIINIASIAGLAGNPPGTMRPSPTTPPKARWSTSPARWRASGAVTASPSTRWRRASSRRR
jgi:gluconate 5-dehydrogenase